MISPVLIIGFKLSNVTIAISALIVGAILQTIYRKMKKDSDSRPRRKLKSAANLTEPEDIDCE